MVYKQKKSKYWSYKITWNGKVIRKSTKQTNKRVAEQIEAAHRTALAKGEVGIVEKKPAPTFKEFAENEFLMLVKKPPTSLPLPCLGRKLTKRTRRRCVGLAQSKGARNRFVQMLSVYVM